MLCQRLRPQPQQRGQRHAVHVARGRGLRGVDVGVGVDPEHADLLLLAAIELRHAGDRPRRQRVVPAQHQRRHAFFKRLHHGFGGARAGFGNLLQIAGVLAAKSLGFGNFDEDITAVGDLVAQRLKPRLEAGNAHGRGAHVDPAAAGAHVQRNTDDANAPGGLSLGSAGWKHGAAAEVVSTLLVMQIVSPGLGGTIPGP